MVAYHVGDEILVPNKLSLIHTGLDEKYQFLSDQLPEKVKCLLASNTSMLLLQQTDAHNCIRIKNPDKSSPIYLVCKIICPGDMARVIMLTVSSPHKIWLNESLVGACQSPPLSICSCLFQKGENVLVIELPPTAALEVALRLRISSYDKEQKPSMGSLLNGNYVLEREHFTVLYNQCDFRRGRVPFEYMVIPRDFLQTDFASGVQVRAVQSHPTEPGQKNTDFGRIEYLKKYTVDTRDLDYGNISLLNHIQLQFECRLLEGKIETLGVEHFYYDLKPAKDRYIDMAVDLLKGDDISQYDRLVLIYYIDDLIHHTGDVIHDYVSLVELRQAIEYIYEEGCNDIVRYEPGYRKIFYYSELDQTIRHYLIAVPDGYSQEKKYPLFLNLSIGDYSYDASCYYEYKGVPLLAADISGRGVTMGSYIGEASIQEIYRHIRSIFSVDGDRIYCTGNSNGAGATWNQAQNFPHMFAGIFPVSCHVNPKRINNLKNLKIINVCAKDDHLYQKGFQNVNASLKRFPNYTGLLIDKMNHDHIHFMRCKQQYIEEMLQVKRDLYPDSIYYTTERNRHRTAYWLTIDGISFGKTTARVSADIIGGDIHINCQNVTGITITIPPQIQREKFSVIVNRSRRFDFVNYPYADLHIVKDKIFRLAERAPCKPVSRKGTGLLDVYFGPVSILVGDSKNKSLLASAQNFAHPGCSGFDPRIYVDYPISDIRKYPGIRDTNLIIIDCNIKHFYLEQLRGLCPITMEEDHFRYMGEQFYGDYCIMQVIPSPDNPENSILYINCSKPELLRKNLFTRKLVIPSYIHGVHRCLNSEGLVFYNGQYFSAQEWGSKLLPVMDL